MHVLEPIYVAISWIMLRWHALWDWILPGREFLATNWDWVLAIVFLVITVRGILFPVYVKQIKSQRAMQQLAPQIKALQEKHKGDRETLQRATMELYRKEGANPLMGCLPMAIQIPVMWSLYHVLRHLRPTVVHTSTKTAYGWTVSQFDAASHSKLLGAPIAASFRTSQAELTTFGANGTTVKIVAGLLVIIMIVSTYMTSRQMILKTGWAEDPTQKMMQRLMLYGIPVTLLFSGFTFPLGVVLYWTTTNIFSLGQQYWVLHKYPPPPMARKSGSSTNATATRTASPSKGTAGKTGKAGTERTRPLRGTVKKATEAVGPAAVDGKALAPKPGAKPENPKRTPVKKAGTAAKKASTTQTGTGKRGSTDAAKRASG